MVPTDASCRGPQPVPPSTCQVPRGPAAGRKRLAVRAKRALTFRQVTVDRGHAGSPRRTGRRGEGSTDMVDGGLEPQAGGAQVECIQALETKAARLRDEVIELESRVFDAERALEVFAWERHVDAYDALYRRLIGDGPRSGRLDHRC